AAHDPEWNYQNFIQTCLDAGNMEVVKAPHNLLRFFGSDTAVWALSVLLHLSVREFRNPEMDQAFKKRLRDTVRRHMDSLAPLVPAASSRTDEFADYLEGQKTRAKANLDYLLTELGAHDLRRRHQIIRYLHRLILGPKRRHNFIHRHLSTAMT